MGPGRSCRGTRSRPGAAGCPGESSGDDAHEHVSGHSADALKPGLELGALVWIRFAHGTLDEYRQHPIGQQLSIVWPPTDTAQRAPGDIGSHGCRWPARSSWTAAVDGHGVGVRAQAAQRLPNTVVALLGKDPQRLTCLDAAPVALEPLDDPMQHLELIRPQFVHETPELVHLIMIYGWSTNPAEVVSSSVASAGPSFKLVGPDLVALVLGWPWCGRESARRKPGAFRGVSFVGCLGRAASWCLPFSQSYPLVCPIP